MDALVFTNDYAPDPVDVDVPVEKILTGHAVLDDKTFEFTLTPLLGAPLPDGKTELTASVVGDGLTDFEAITFDTASTYSYEVFEVDGGEPGYGYDAARYTVEVVVSDDDGELTATWAANAEVVDALTFSNVYAPDAVTLSLPVEKQLVGHAVTENKIFSFILTGVGNVPMPADAVEGMSTISIVGEGVNAFGVMTFDKVGGGHVYLPGC